VKRIDNPLDAAMSQLEENPENSTLEIVAKLATLVPLLAPLDALRDHFSTRNRINRIYEVLSVFQSEYEALRMECAQEKARRAEIDAYLRSTKFTDAVVAAAEEAARTANAEKIKRFARVLANGSDPRIEASDDDLSSFIRDVSQLSEVDLRTLEIIISTVGIMSWESYVPDETDGLLGQHLVRAAAQEKLQRDDFYSHAYRLVGFGLALEAPSGTGRRLANDLRFLPTRRGRKLLALLKKRT
jgi:hypothetical protein